MSGRRRAARAALARACRLLDLEAGADDAREAAAAPNDPRAALSERLARSSRFRGRGVRVAPNGYWDAAFAPTVEPALGDAAKLISIGPRRAAAEAGARLLARETLLEIDRAAVARAIEALGLDPRPLAAAAISAAPRADGLRATGAFATPRRARDPDARGRTLAARILDAGGRGIAAWRRVAPAPIERLVAERCALPPLAPAARAEMAADARALEAFRAALSELVDPLETPTRIGPFGAELAPKAA